MSLSTLDNALWAASLIGHVALVIVLVRKGLFRKFPIFTLFVASEVARTVLLFFVFRYGSNHSYFRAYWATGFANYGFQILIMYEVARDVLRPTGTWVRDARKAFLGWGAVGLVVAAALAMRLGPPESKGFDLWDARVTVFTSMLTCELFIAMAAAANRLGLQWRNRVFAVGQGLAIWAFISLLEDFGHAALGWDRAFESFVYVRMLVYLSVLVYWMVAFSLPERVRAPLSDEMQAYLLALHQRVQYDLQRVDGAKL